MFKKKKVLRFKSELKKIMLISHSCFYFEECFNLRCVHVAHSSFVLGPNCPPYMNVTRGRSPSEASTFDRLRLHIRFQYDPTSTGGDGERSSVFHRHRHQVPQSSACVMFLCVTLQ